jgi:hypothetical protein
MNDTSIDLTSVVPIRAFVTQIFVANRSAVISDGRIIGGYIINPNTAEDQNLSYAHSLFVDPTGPANNIATSTTIELRPGDRYNIPPNVETGIWVNSTASGHKFIAVLIIPQYLFQPIQFIDNGFPPPGPTGRLINIPSYLFQEYSDDENLQAFVAAYNKIQQDIVDTYNGLHLPDYTSDPISGALLDWVANGIYGIYRPNLQSFTFKTLGTYNTAQYNTIEYDYFKLLYPTALSFTNDDIFRRIISWHVCKADGKYFSIATLKKRIMRFLYGTNGKYYNVDQHYQISITFGPNYECTIRFILWNRTITDGTLYDQNKFMYNTMQYNQIDTISQSFPPLPNMEIFKEAVLSGVLELPFQYHYDVTIG